MNKDTFLRIINEEIQDFDFLGNDKQQEEQVNIDLLKNEELQKQFICDSLLNRNTKIKIIGVSDARIGGDWEETDVDDANRLTIEYFLKVQYKYDPNKEPLTFGLDFNSDSVSIGRDSNSEQGDYNTAPSGQDWFNRFNWLDIDVTLSTLQGDKIDFLAFEKAPERIKTLFIREFTEDFIIKSTNLDIRTKEMTDKPQNVPYC